MTNMTLSELIEAVRTNQRLWDADELMTLQIYDMLLKLQYLLSDDNK